MITTPTLSSPHACGLQRALVALALCAPLAAGAQAYRCVDAASGRTLYTDQPCKGGATVVPKPTEEQLQRDAERAQEARERSLQQREQTVQREQDRLDAARSAEAQRPPPAAAPSESQACRAAREEASFRAASVTATEEQIRTARANAALACGQPAPPEIVVAPPPRWRPHVYPRPDRYPGYSGPAPWPRAVDSQPSYAPGTEPLPMTTRPPSATR
ncbi:DUF4124 domain-containing protein [Ottowia pentelensis]|uniref:DUF4124 domain-containing protein n=1 Tax=Ottowia pentelensis TaxID=511108 RepID=UPI00360ABF63